MMHTKKGIIPRMRRFLRLFFLNRAQRQALRAVRKAKLFDAVYYRGAYPMIHPLFHRFPLRHYIVYGETDGFRPNPDFSPEAYLRYNPDVAHARVSPTRHFAEIGQREMRLHKDIPIVEELPSAKHLSPLQLEIDRPRAPVAIVIHIYYPELWPEFAEIIRRATFEFDLFVTLTYRGETTETLAEEIREEFPKATVLPVENRGRDILPFLRLINAGVLDGYDAVCKVHTKKSPHRKDGELWRRHLIAGVLPEQGSEKLLSKFLDRSDAAFLVADGQYYSGAEWWGSNYEITASLLRRLEIEINRDELYFPAGSIYWTKPIIIGLLKAMKLDAGHFDVEQGQVDATVAHAIERAMGLLARAAGQHVLQTSELENDLPAKPRPAAEYVSAFYLPQFHPVPDNDRWWGPGYTEWRGVARAESMFDGHQQPILPADLGFYDLRVTDVMGQQTEMAHAAGIDAFCVYHYWFDGRRILEEPLNRLLERPDIDFPFYLCWANESWRRNWDGLSGTVLLEQTYAKGFEKQLVADSLPYMRDPRYQRPDGTRPRFVIYRPEDMPDPAGSVAHMRQAWRDAGIGEVELGAVCFHVSGKNPVESDLFDFWIEMPPHGIVSEPDYLFGGPKGNRLDRQVHDKFTGLVYDYTQLMQTSVSSKYVRTLPNNTICGIMPSWDNSARRKHAAHIAYGANPASFNRWLDVVMEKRLPTSYRGELFVNAWNEWAEKAMLEPSLTYGNLYLQVLGSHLGDKRLTPKFSDEAEQHNREAQSA